MMAAARWRTYDVHSLPCGRGWRTGWWRNAGTAWGRSHGVWREIFFSPPSFLLGAGFDSGVRPVAVRGVQRGQVRVAAAPRTLGAETVGAEGFGARWVWHYGAGGESEPARLEKFSVDSVIHWFIQQIFTKPLLSARYCSTPIRSIFLFHIPICKRLLALSGTEGLQFGKPEANREAWASLPPAPWDSH